MLLNISLIILGCIVLVGLGYFLGSEVVKCDLEAQKLETRFYQHWVETMQREFDKYIIQKISEEES